MGGPDPPDQISGGSGLPDLPMDAPMDEAARTLGGRAFQARAAAIAKARSSIVVRHVDGTSREDLSS